MDTSGRRHKRTHEASSSNGKRRKFSTTPEPKSSSGSPKVRCSAQNRLAMIRMKQAAEEVSKSPSNSSFESSIDHSNISEYVVKFPLSEQENTSFNWSPTPTRKTPQGRLSNGGSFHSSTPLASPDHKRHSKSYDEAKLLVANKSWTLLMNERSERKNRPDDKFKSSVSERLKKYSADERGEQVSNRFDGRFKVKSTTDSASKRLLLQSTSLESGFKRKSSPTYKSVSERLKTHSSSSIESVKTSPCKKIREFDNEIDKSVRKDKFTPDKLFEIDKHNLKTQFKPEISSGDETCTPLLKTQLFEDETHKLGFKAESTSFEHKAQSTLATQTFQSPFKSATAQPDTTANAIDSLPTPPASFNSFKVEATPKKIALETTPENSFNHSNDIIPSSLFPSFGFVSDTLKTLSTPLSSFFKSASVRFKQSVGGESKVTPLKSTSNVSPLRRFAPYTNKPATRDHSKGTVDLDSFEDSFCSNSGSKSNVSGMANSSDSRAMEEDCDMDWSPETQEDIVADIRTAREKISAHNQTSFHTFSSENSPQTMDEASGVDNNGNLYLIVDTNVFINKLQILASILKIEYEDGTFPIVYVPWMVIQELDYFKDGYNVSEKHVASSALKTKSMKAIRFVNENLISKRTNFQCQPVLDATENQLKILSPDDSILSCCFQVGKHSRVMLLSSDINLCNKAMINNFGVLKPEDAVETLSELKKLKHKDDLIKKVSECMSRLCSFIIYSEWKQKGDREDAARFKRMPWNFPDCIRYMRENYARVFKPFLQKQSQKIIDDIYNMLILNQDLAEETKFIELVLSLLIFMKTGLSKYELNIQGAIEDIKKLKNTNNS